MTDEKLLKTIQNDIKNLDKCIEMCIDEEGIEYLKTIKQNMTEQEIEIVKRMSIKKALKEQQKWIKLLNTTKAQPNQST